MIFLYHIDILKYGYLAVDSFIVLSGFLSIASIERHGHFKFLYYRFIRIYKPLAILFILLILLKFIFWHNYFHEFSISTLQTMFLFFETWVGRLSNLNYFDVTNFHPGIYLWSLSIEIKF